jgi:hypothetical protein
MHSPAAGREGYMRASRTNEPIPFTPPSRRGREHDAAVTVLREMVEALAERVEILETREALTSTRLSPERSRHRPGR